jgi:hypothetical protein
MAVPAALSAPCFLRMRTTGLPAASSLGFLPMPSSAPRSRLTTGLPQIQDFLSLD